MFATPVMGPETKLAEIWWVCHTPACVGHFRRDWPTKCVGSYFLVVGNGNSADGSGVREVHYFAGCVGQSRREWPTDWLPRPSQSVRSICLDGEPQTSTASVGNAMFGLVAKRPGAREPPWPLYLRPISQYRPRWMLCQSALRKLLQAGACDYKKQYKILFFTCDALRFTS